MTMSFRQPVTSDVFAVWSLIETLWETWNKVKIPVYDFVVSLMKHCQNFSNDTQIYMYLYIVQSNYSAKPHIKASKTNAPTYWASPSCHHRVCVLVSGHVKVSVVTFWSSNWSRLWNHVIHWISAIWHAIHRISLLSMHAIHRNLLPKERFTEFALALTIVLHLAVKWQLSLQIISMSWSINKRIIETRQALMRSKLASYPKFDTDHSDVFPVISEHVSLLTSCCFLFGGRRGYMILCGAGFF